ncbi:MAG: mechanosensitive ion channel [Chlamydiales bacterium]|nr:mechanosensitive ion channel [Chlamydiales bacterium]
MIDKEFKQFISSIELTNIISFILLVIALIISAKGINVISCMIIKKFPHKRMRIFQWIPIFSFLLYFFGIIAGIYFIFEPSQEVFLWFIASTIVAFAFALKEILTSLISGVILLIDKPFQVGDRVTFESTYGEITSIGLRSVKLLTLDESVVTIPNSRFMNDIVSSSSAGQLNMMTTVDVYVSVNENLSQLKDILEKIASASPYINTEKKPFVIIKETLGIGGVISAVMTTKCILKDARKEKTFQTDFLINVNQELHDQSIQRKTKL